MINWFNLSLRSNLVFFHAKPLSRKEIQDASGMTALLLSLRSNLWACGSQPIKGRLRNANRCLRHDTLRYVAILMWLFFLPHKNYHVFFVVKFLCLFFLPHKNCNIHHHTSTYIMGLITYIREQLDISQQDLSEYLSIQRANLSMIEIDQRNISVHKMVEVMELHDALELLNKPEDLDTVQALQAEEDAKMQAWAAERRIILKAQQRTVSEKLAKMKADYQILIRALHAFTKSIQNLQDKKEVQKKWLRVHRSRIADKLAKNGKQSIMQLEIKLACIEKELEMLG
jgi:transcriptional regulator with XRE-family HTH domain